MQTILGMVTVEVAPSFPRLDTEFFSFIGEYCLDKSFSIGRSITLAAMMVHCQSARHVFPISAGQVMLGAVLDSLVYDCLCSLVD